MGLWVCENRRTFAPRNRDKNKKKNGYENNESNANARVLLLLYDGKVNERRNIYNRCK